MYILNNEQKAIYDSACIERYIVTQKSDTVLVEASLNVNRGGTLGRYNTLKEAKDALYRLYSALVSGDKYFDMPPRVMMEPVKKDARIVRKGGS